MDPSVIIVPSIVIDDLLVRCVEACRRISPRTEVIVVVDDTTGADRLIDKATVVSSPDPSIGAKRNLAAAMSTSRHLAFIDSDAYPIRGWPDNAVALLDADAGLGAVGGPNISPPHQGEWETAVGHAHRSVFVDGWWRYRKVRTGRRRDVPALPTCNLVVRRADYEAVGGMDEELFTGEDTDFCARLTARGRRIRFAPEVVVYHKDRDLRAFVIQRYTFGVAIVPLVRRGTRPDPAYLAAAGAVSALVLFLASGPVGIAVRPWRRIWARGALAYGCALAAEAVRLVGVKPLAARVAFVLAIGNLAPGIGALSGVLGLYPNLRGIYRNDR